MVSANKDISFLILLFQNIIYFSIFYPIINGDVVVSFNLLPSLATKDEWSQIKTLSILMTKFNVFILRKLNVSDDI